MSNSKKILFQLSGSIACYKSCDLISKLVQQGHEVRCAVTQEALRFIGLATLEGLSGKSVFTDIYQAGQQMQHIHLNEWADLVILHPATATTINAMAAGIGQNLVAQLFLSFPMDRPYIVFPAMNHKMLKHPTTQESMSRLQDMGIHIMDTNKGSLACGEHGYGRVLETAEALEKLEDFL